MALATEFKGVSNPVTLDPGPTVTQDHSGAEGRSRAGHARLDSQRRTACTKNGGLRCIV
jgi:hypothetical protein